MLTNLDLETQVVQLVVQLATVRDPNSDEYSLEFRHTFARPAKRWRSASRSVTFWVHGGTLVQALHRPATMTGSQGWCALPLEYALEALETKAQEPS
jgi:hypothetical protein